VTRVKPARQQATDTLLRQLGPAPVDLAGQNLVEILASAYAAIAERAEERPLE
jgi:hypothetical protein